MFAAIYIYRSRDREDVTVNLASLPRQDGRSRLDNVEGIEHEVA